MTAAPPALSRRLALPDAVAIGVGSMVGAGVFAVWGPATAAAGSWLLVALAIAAVIAFCNATSSAQLAAQFPVSGGTYVYGREMLNPWFGYAAGWCFVIGKTASCAAMALTFAAYVVPGADDHAARTLVAVAVVAVLTVVNCLGVTRTALLTKVIVSVVLAALVVTLALGFTSGDSVFPTPLATPSLAGVLQAAGLLFFAFAGYARIATMGEEVTTPARTIPRAIVTSLAVALAVYVLVALLVTRTLGGAVIGSSQPLQQVARTLDQPWLVAALGVAAALATAGALLNLMTGIGRTSLAMAREGDFPRWLARIETRTQVPLRAEVLLGIVVAVMVITVDLRGVIGFSSFGVLLYYAIANAAALRQQGSERRWPRALQVLGAVGCVVLAFTLPLTVVLVGAGVVAVGLVVRLVVVQYRRRFDA